MNLRYAWAVLLALVLTWASVSIINIPWVVGDEAIFAQYSTRFKKVLNNNLFKGRLYDSTFIERNFLLINTTNDQELTINSSNDPDRLKNPGTPITNRKSLKELFRMLNKADSLYQFIVCDVLFELPSVVDREDDSLKYYMNELQIKNKILFAVSGSRGENNGISMHFQNIKPQNVGSTIMQPVSGYFTRQKLIYDNFKLKSLPLLMYQRYYGIDVKQSIFPGLIIYERKGNSKSYYNTFMPEIYFDRAWFDRKYVESEGVYDENMLIIDLGVVVSDSTGLYLDAILPTSAKQKKIVFIGAIRGDHIDKHITYYGNLDGAIILINTYHGLVLQQNIFDIWLWVISFLFFLIISWRVILGRDRDAANNTGFWLIMRHKIIDRLYYILLTILTLISSLVFNRSTNLIALIIIIEILHSLVRFLRNYRLQNNVQRSPDNMP